jgi:hypothetical protein
LIAGAVKLLPARVDGCTGYLLNGNGYSSCDGQWVDGNGKPVAGDTRSRLGLRNCALNVDPVTLGVNADPEWQDSVCH